VQKVIRRKITGDTSIAAECDWHKNNKLKTHQENIRNVALLEIKNSFQ
jgi:hypothetical protein